MSILHAILRFSHITAGSLVLITGVLSMSFTKGSRPHRWAGNIFFGSMLVVGLAGLTLALMRRPTPNVGNVMGGSMALYMVATAWLTVIRPPGQVGRTEIALAVLGLLVATTAAVPGVIAMNSPKGVLAGYPWQMYFIFGGVALAAACSDFWMIHRGGVVGRPRLVRHLWRMCLSFFLATGSFFFGQPKFVPAILKETNLYIVAGVLPLVLMVFWLARVTVFGFSPVPRRRT